MFAHKQVLLWEDVNFFLLTKVEFVMQDDKSGLWLS